MKSTRIADNEDENEDEDETLTRQEMRLKIKQLSSGFWASKDNYNSRRVSSRQITNN